MIEPLKGMTPLRCFEAHARLVEHRAAIRERTPGMGTYALNDVIEVLAEAVRLGLRRKRRRGKR